MVKSMSRAQGFYFEVELQLEKNGAWAGHWPRRQVQVESKVGCP